MPRTAEDARTMQEVTRDLGVHYKAWKDNEKAKERDKARFWALINDEVRDLMPRDEKLVETPGHRGRGLSEENARALIERIHPRYAVEAMRASEDGWEAILVERPEYTPYFFVNTEDGMVYQRQVVDGSVLIDDDALAVDEPVLYALVTFELPWGERIVRPLDSLPPEQLAATQDYIYRGKPTVKLPAPRPATDEELESVGA